MENGGALVKRWPIVDVGMYSGHENVVSDGRNKEKNEGLTSYSVMHPRAPSQCNMENGGALVKRQAIVDVGMYSTDKNVVSRGRNKE